MSTRKPPARGKPAAKAPKTGKDTKARARTKPAGATKATTKATTKGAARQPGRTAVEKKAHPRARSSRAPIKRQTPERVAVDRVRTLGDVDRGGTIPSRGARPARTGVDATMAANARAILQREFERALALNEKMAAEVKIGREEKGRDSKRQPQKLRSILASLEGMNRFALKMGLITPAESRALYAEAMKQGLYQGWQ